MKILKMILENFSNINTALETTKIELDFSKSVNNVILLIGPNGSGKTSILSLLTPFATLGNLDVRDGNDLILEGERGYKEIHIKNHNDVYIIKHYYTPSKTTHSVKSYIEKNGNELNINGNVTSFKEIVKEELYVELDYLKLIRIGNNVKSLIDLSGTERKNYMSKIMSDIDLWLIFYKKVNNDLRQLKDMIARNVSKINRLGISNIDDMKSNKKDLEKIIVDMNEKYEGMLSNISIIRSDLSKIDSPLTLKDRYIEATKKLKKMDKIIQRKDEYESVDTKYYEERISQIKLKISELKNNIKSSEEILDTYLEQMDKLYEQERIYEVQLKKELDSDKELSSMEKQLRLITNDIDQLKEQIGDFKPSYTKNEFEEFVVFLKNAQQKFDQAYDCGKEVIEKTISLMREGKNVIAYVNRHIMELEPENDSRSSLFLQEIKRRFKLNREITCSVKSECDAFKIYTQLINIINSSSDNDSNKFSLEFYQGIEMSYQYIISVLPLFQAYKDIIDNLPKTTRDWFSTETLFKNLEKQKIIYNENEINFILSLVTDYENMKTYMKESEMLKKDIERFSKMSNLSYVKSQLEEVQDNITEYSNRITKLKRQISNYREELFQNERDLESSEELKETFEKYDQTVKNQNTLENEYKTYTMLLDSLKTMEDNKNKLEKAIAKYRSDLQKMVFTINQYKELSKELKIFNITYDEMVLVKESLSSKKGIPLFYIKRYFNEIQDSTNELLDIVCNGDLYIDKFDITADDFTIPFFRKGKRLKDVELASQGELSLFKIALAFAISANNISEYNIILMDEINAALDRWYSEKFLLLVEKQRAKIGADQIFLISHKDIGASYPVDIIDLTDRSNSGILHIF